MLVVLEKKVMGSRLAVGGWVIFILQDSRVSVEARHVTKLVVIAIVGRRCCSRQVEKKN